MESGENGGARPRQAARGKGKAPGPPPPPPSRDEANGGHRSARVKWRRVPVRGEVFAFAVMAAAAAYFLLAEALAGAPPAAAWYFAAFLLWIIGQGLLFSFMS